VAKKSLVSRAKEAFERAGRAAQAESASRAGSRPTPAKRGTVARAGGYAAPVDTAGMDSSMKRTLGLGRKKKP
jgi:hypothetical protein